MRVHVIIHQRPYIISGGRRLVLDDRTMRRLRIGASLLTFTESSRAHGNVRTPKKSYSCSHRWTASYSWLKGSASTVNDFSSGVERFSTPSVEPISLRYSEKCRGPHGINLELLRNPPKYCAHSVCTNAAGGAAGRSWNRS